MSGKQTGLVWDHVISGNKRLVILALADAANHDGSSCFPSVARVAWMTGLSERTVQRIIRVLEVPSGPLVRVKDARRHRPTEYRLVIRALPRKPSFRRGDNLSPLASQSEVTTSTPRGDSSAARGDTVASPDPSPDPSDPSERLIAFWIEQRIAAGHRRFIDDRACRWLRTEIARATARGNRLTDIERAIHMNVRESFADPRQLPSWINRLASERAQHEAALKQQRARADARARRDAEVDANWDDLHRRHPGLSKREILERYFGRR